MVQDADCDDVTVIVVDEEVGNVTLVQKTTFPTSSSTTITVTSSQSASWTIYLRIPSWTTDKATITVNGQASTVKITPGTYAAFTQQWVSGNTITADFPMNFYAEKIQDTRSQYNPEYAFLYGPLLLAGLTNSPFLPGSPTDLSWFQRTSTTSLNFTAKDENGQVVNFIPLLNVMSEHYTIYFNTSGVPIVHYNANGSPVDTSTGGAFMCSGGAATISNPTLSLRSGNPHETNTVYIATGIQDNTHPVDGLTLDYSYVTGYGTGVGTNFTIYFESSSGADTVVYQSPQLTNYSYDSCDTCYSPPVPVSKTGLNLAATSMVRIKFVFQDNDKNVQLKLPFNVTVLWR